MKTYTVIRSMEVFNALNLVLAVLFTFILFTTNASATVDQTPWTSLLGSAGDDYGDDIVVDAAGNSYVTGYTTDSLGGDFQGGTADMFVAKFDPAGNVLWVNQEGTTEFDRATRITLDAAGNVYVTGYTRGSLAGTNPDDFFDYFIIKYDQDGNRIWGNQYGGVNGQYGFGINVAPSGDIYVCGEQYHLTATGFPTYYAFITKYDSAGTQSWTDVFGAESTTTNQPPEYCTDVTIGNDGFIYMTGAASDCLTATCLGGGDIFVAKYDSVGNRKWLMETGTTGWDIPGKIAVDAAGNSYVSASTSETFSGLTTDFDDMITVKVNTNGVSQWVRQIGTTSLDQGYGVAVDSNGIVYAVGTYGEGPAIALVKYDNNGVQLSLDTMASGNGDYPAAIAVDSAGTNYYITGDSSGNLDGQINAGVGADVFVTHNNPTPVPVAVPVTVPDVVGLSQADATSIIEAEGLVVAIVERFDPVVPVGDVISQNPVSGTSVAEGSTVTLTVSLGPDVVTVTVPDVVGLTQAAAVAAIEDVGLVASKTFENSDTVAAGDVISQTPAGGTTIAEGSTVNLVVSLGPTPALIEVPNVVGTTYSSAIATIEAAGLTVGNVTTVRTFRSCGIVRSQSPTAGTDVAPGTAIALVVTRTRFCNPL